MKRKKQFRFTTVFIATLLLIFSFFIGYAYGGSAIRLIVNGIDIHCDVPPFIKNGRTFVPVRNMVEALHIPVIWNASKRAVIVGIPPEGVDLVNTIPAYNGYEAKISNYVVVCGTKYNNGYQFGYKNRKVYSQIRWNLGGRYSTFSFHCQYADISTGYQWNEGCIKIFADGEEISSEIIKRDDGLLEFSYDISGKNTICVKGDYYYEGMCIINPMAKSY